MWPPILLLLQFTLITSLPLTEDARESRPGECCPCGQDARSTDGSESEASAVVPAVLPGPLQRSGGCPCMLRDADPSAAASFDSPRQVLPFRPPVSLSDEDPKPLLHPEVDLASSVLETLREATDEEYREALARDAARSETRSAADQESSPSIVTIILNPGDLDDDVLAQGTHTHEARCIHGPLGSARVANIKRRPLPILLRELLGMPVDTKRTNFDNAIAASNVREQIVDSSNVKEVKVKPEAEFKSSQGPTTPKLPSLIDNVKEFTSKVRSNYENAVKNMPKLNLPLNIRLNDNNDFNSSLKEPTKPIEKNSNIIENVREDTDNSASNVQEKVVAEDGENVPVFSDKIVPSFLPRENALDALKPILPKNLIKFRDADSITKSLLDNIGEKEVKIKVPYLKVKSLFGEEAKSDADTNSLTIPSIRDLLSGNSVSTTAENVTKPDVHSEITLKPEIADKDTNNFRTEIIDAVPSASENIQVEQAPALPENSIKSVSAQIEANSDDCDHSPFNRGDVPLETMTEVTLVDPVVADQIQNLEPLNIDSSLELSDSSSSIETKGVGSFETLPADNVIEQIEISNQNPEIPESIDYEIDLSGENVDLVPILNNEEVRSNPVTSMELQNMSDTLLDESRSRDTIVDQNCVHNDKNEKVKEAATTALKPQEDQDVEPASTVNDPMQVPSTEDITPDVTKSPKQNDEKPAKATCDAQSLQAKNSRVSSKAPAPEMTAESSDAVPNLLQLPSLLDRNSLLGSRLMQSPIVQPATLPDIGSILPDLSDIFGSTPAIPTLDELRSRISDFFRMANDDLDDQGEDSNINAPKKLTAPLSLRRPMEDVDFDIFQFKPLTSSRTSSPKFSIPSRGLNLNSYKARLQVPADVIKPLQLQAVKSFKGKDGNILGAKLSMAPKLPKLGSLGRPRTTLLSDISSRRDNLLGSSLPQLPTLESIRSALNPNKLLEPSRSMLPDLRPIENLRSSEPLVQLDAFRENLRSDASNTITNLQESLASTLNEAKLRHDSVLGNPVSLPIQSTDLLNNLEKARSDLSERFQAMHSDIAEKFNNLPSLQTPTSNLRTPQPKFVTSPEKSSVPQRKPKTSKSNTKLKTSPSNGSILSTSSSKLRDNLDGLDSKRPLKVKAPTSTSRATASGRKVLTKVPKLKAAQSLSRDPNFAASDSIPSHFSATPSKWFSKDTLKSLEPLDIPTLRANSKSDFSRKPKPSLLKSDVKIDIGKLELPQRKQSSLRTSQSNDKSNKAAVKNFEATSPSLLASTKSDDSLMAQVRSTVNNRLTKANEGLTSILGNSRSSNSVNRPDLPKTLGRPNYPMNTRLSSFVKSQNDMIEGESQRDSMIGLPKLSIENLKKPHEVVEDILTSARERLSNVNLNLPLPKLDERLQIVKSPAEISDQLRSTLEDLNTNVLEKAKNINVASPDEVLTTLRDTIRERFSDVDLSTQRDTLSKVTDMAQGASERLKNVASASETVFDNLKNSVNDRLSSLNLPQLKSAGETKKIDLLNVDLPSPDEVVSKLRESAKETFKSLSPLPSLPDLKSRSDSVSGASENLKALLDAPAKSLDSDPLITKLRSSLKDRLTDLQVPVAKNEETTDLRSNNDVDESVEDSKREPESLVTKLRNSIKDRFSNIESRNRVKDLDNSPSDNLQTSMAVPRKALKKNVTYRCKMVCEEVEDE